MLSLLLVVYIFATASSCVSALIVALNYFDYFFLCRHVASFFFIFSLRFGRRSLFMLQLKHVPYDIIGRMHFIVIAVHMYFSQWAQEVINYYYHNLLCSSLTRIYFELWLCRVFGLIEIDV